MCLVSKTKMTRKTASEDIVVYKSVKDDLTSPCFNFQYEVGKTYTEKIDTQFESAEVFEYFFGYTKTENKEIKAGAYRCCNGYKIERGLHSFKFEPKEGLYWRVKSGDMIKTETVLECVIPEGSEYYEGNAAFVRGLCAYVSDALKITKVIRTKR